MVMYICVVFLFVQLLLRDVNLLLTCGLDATDRSVWGLAALFRDCISQFYLGMYSRCLVFYNGNVFLNVCLFINVCVCFYIFCFFVFVLLFCCYILCSSVILFVDSGPLLSLSASVFFVLLSFN